MQLYTVYNYLQGAGQRERSESVVGHRLLDEVVLPDVDPAKFRFSLGEESARYDTREQEFARPRQRLGLRSLAAAGLFPCGENQGSCFCAFATGQPPESVTVIFEF